MPLSVISLFLALPEQEDNERAPKTKVGQCQRNVGLTAAVAGLKGGGHADLFIVRRGQSQHHLADGDEFLRAVVAHQDRIAVLHLEVLLFLP